MEENHYYIIFIAALVPLLIGFIWYNPKVFGNAWMQTSGMTEEKMKGSNMALIFGLTYLLSIFIAFFLPIVVIHQYGVFSLLNDSLQSTDAGVREAATTQLQNFNQNFGGMYRTFGHGALHGFMMAFFVVLPVIAINALFERKGAKYIFINWGYWAVSIMLMGGILCRWL